MTLADPPVPAHAPLPIEAVLYDQATATHSVPFPPLHATGIPENVSPNPTDSQELVAARRKVARDAAARLRAAQEKRARAEARRARHFEQLGEARRVAAVAKAEAEVATAMISCAARFPTGKSIEPNIESM